MICSCLRSKHRIEWAIMICLSLVVLIAIIIVSVLWIRSGHTDYVATTESTTTIVITTITTTESTTTSAGAFESIVKNKLTVICIYFS